MSWIKRNLYFLVGGIVAVVLLGVAGFYCYSKWALNNDSLAKLDEAYTDWDRISGLNPNPGNEKIDNIKLARDQKLLVRETIKKVVHYFEPIPPIPNVGNSAEAKDNFASSFRSALRRTIDQLQRDAANANITLTQPGYNFSFKAQKDQFNFAAGSLGPLSLQLGEIKAICDNLFHSRINSLDNLQRERVSTDDINGTQSDYLDPTLISVTNELAVLTPYTITFHCFSTELAGVLSGFGNGSHSFIVKSVNIEAGSGATTTDSAMGGIGGGGMMPPGFGGAPAPAPTKGGLVVALDERPLKVTLVVDVVKLLPKK